MTHMRAWPGGPLHVNASHAMDTDECKASSHWVLALFHVALKVVAAVGHCVMQVVSGWVTWLVAAAVTISHGATALSTSSAANVKLQPL